MNILFLGISTIESSKSRGIYADLLSELSNSHNIFCVTSVERRKKIKTHVNHEKQFHSLLVKTLNMQKTNYFEKTLSTFSISNRYIRAIKKHFKNIHFDLVIYPTPPITLYKAIKFFKKKHSSKTYLLLKDIFPQNAIDLGIMTKRGLKGLLYLHFRRIEKSLYNISDAIGCMSLKNKEYLVHNNDINDNKIEIFPNSIRVEKTHNKNKEDVRRKYNIPIDKKVFIYGGNIGRPQDSSFIISCLDSQKNNTNIHFVIAGDGTDFWKILKFSRDKKIANLTVISSLKRTEFEALTSACDVGLIFLDYRFTIPNFPSRFLSYLKAGIPTLACTDINTDLKDVIIKNNLGWWCPSNSVDRFCKTIKLIESTDTLLWHNRITSFLQDHYSVEKAIENAYILKEYLSL